MSANKKTTEAYPEVQQDAIILHLNESLKKLDEAIRERNDAIAERDIALTQLESVVTKYEKQAEFLNIILTGSSWRLTRPLRFVQRLVKYGLLNEDRRAIKVKILSLYGRLPMPLKKIINSTFLEAYNYYVKGKDWKLTTANYPRPPFQPKIQNEEFPDYFIWGVIDWHFRHQRPQQLALSIASTGRRVFYISSITFDSRYAGFQAELLNSQDQVYQIKLYACGSPSIYSKAPESNITKQLLIGIGELLKWANCNQIVSVVNHPYWYDIADVLPNSRLVYDCMDHHEGFGNNGESLLKSEKLLLKSADLVIFTSFWLKDNSPSPKNNVIIRNGCDYDFFSKKPDQIYQEPTGRRIIGYYGAIAEWFDQDLVEKIAIQHPDCFILLVGADSVNAKCKLGKLSNVSFIGEVPYDNLPYYLYAFDLCLLPFKVIPLTLATNPVKVYEYLCAGKPVISVDLPELHQFEGLVYIAEGKSRFLENVSQALSREEPLELFDKRRAFAKEQTWSRRAISLIKHSENSSDDPKVSVIIVTYKNLDLTVKCLESIEKYAQYEPLEVIVVDNASSDGTKDYLYKWSNSGENRRIILNDTNRGFAAANNQGLETANGDFFLLLNNDTFITPGSIRTLVRHLLRDSSIGVIGPVTNNIGNEAKIDISYNGMEEMVKLASDYTRNHVGVIFPLKTTAFFCVMIPRVIFETVGNLDEAYGIGWFEDDDYCRRIEQIGKKIICAEDVFIHHHLSAAFDTMKKDERKKLFEINKEIYERKWGIWERHNYHRR